ncbi:Cubilin [Holothuria leucospilota]|uniref:Cubilin n=1 Tax=Holothuria leucospilota TaxID=206669 RepID=A0A9Q1H1V6_HOLLE|nr:Cubilin [Holothuria leucospilota]
MEGSSQNRICLANRITVFTIVILSFQHGSAKGDSTMWLRKPFGEFKSKGYPDLDDDMYCTWKIFAPQDHRITIHFNDFQLLKIWICKDKVEIYDGDVKLGTYRGTELRFKSITSTSNTMRVILDTCSTSLWWDRKGIHVSYSTVYPTTLERETAKKMTTTQPTTARSSTATITDPFSTQINTMQSSLATFTPTSLTSFEQNSDMPSFSSSNEYASTRASVWYVGILLAGLSSIAIVVTIFIFVVKRKCSPSNVANSVGDANRKQVDLTTVVTERTGQDTCEINYDYVQGCGSQKARNVNFLSHKKCAKAVSEVSSCRLQKKHPQITRNTDRRVYANDAGNTYYNTDGEDYSTNSCKVQSTSVNTEKHDIETAQNLDGGSVINVAYEPYLPKM